MQFKNNDKENRNDSTGSDRAGSIKKKKWAEDKNEKKILRFNQRR